MDIKQHWDKVYSQKTRPEASSWYTPQLIESLHYVLKTAPAMVLRRLKQKKQNCKSHRKLLKLVNGSVQQFDLNTSEPFAGEGTMRTG
jgi:hypothetical protein